MYRSKFVVTIRQNGQTLPETGEKVSVPFNSEYSIRLHNKTGHDAVAFIDIDGRPVAEGGVVVPANRCIDLERFVEAGQLFQGPRFKFVPLTDSGVDRGQSENGRVEVRFHRITPRPEPIVIHHHHCNNYWCRQCNPRYGLDWKDNQVYCRSNNAFYTSNAAGETAFGAIASSLNAPRSAEAPGATVQGGTSYQSFKEVSFDYDKDNAVTILLRLVGDALAASKTIADDVLAATRNFCTGCGAPHQRTHRFCANCGTKLEAAA